MISYNVAITGAKGNLAAILEADDDIPIGLMLQAVMSHPQLTWLLHVLDINHATALMVTTPVLIAVEPGVRVCFPDGVCVSAPITPAPIANVPDELKGRTIVRRIAVDVTFNTNTPNNDSVGDDDGDEYEGD